MTLTQTPQTTLLLGVIISLIYISYIHPLIVALLDLSILKISNSYSDIQCDMQKKATQHEVIVNKIAQGNVKLDTNICGFTVPDSTELDEYDEYEDE